MAYPISDVTRRIVYSGSAGTGPYSFSFEILAQTDIAVYKNTTLLTLTTDYTVTINVDGTGSITLVSAATGSDQITIVGDRGIARATDFVTGGDLFANSLNDELDSLVIFTQQVDEKADRGLKAPVTDPTDVNMTLPNKATRKGTVLAFNETTGDPEVGPSIADTQSVADSVAAITTVANDLDGSNTIGTVAGSIANVNSVAGNSSNINAVASNATNINAAVANETNINAAVANATNINAAVANEANITAVGANATNINTVATNIADVNTVATNISDVTNFADVYLGAKASDPSTRNDASALQAGDLYFNTAVNEIRAYSGSQWVSGTAGTMAVQRFSGDNSTVAFTLATAPAGESNTQVYINGVYQQKDGYGVSGTTLTFSAAPPTGTNNIEVVTISTLALGQTAANLVSFTQNGTGAVARTVNVKLNEMVSVKDFGAMGDGTTDDYAAFYSALNSGAGAVFVPSATYAIGTNIVLPAGVSLIGEAGNLPVLKFSNGVTIGLMRRAQQSAATIENLSLDLTNITNNCVGILFNGTWRSTIKKVVLNGPGDTDPSSGQVSYGIAFRSLYSAAYVNATQAVALDALQTSSSGSTYGVYYNTVQDFVVASFGYGVLQVSWEDSGSRRVNQNLFIGGNIVSNWHGVTMSGCGGGNSYINCSVESNGGNGINVEKQGAGTAPVIIGGEIGSGGDNLLGNMLAINVTGVTDVVANVSGDIGTHMRFTGDSAKFFGTKPTYENAIKDEFRGSATIAPSSTYDLTTLRSELRSNAIYQAVITTNGSAQGQVAYIYCNGTTSTVSINVVTTIGSQSVWGTNGSKIWVENLSGSVSRTLNWSVRLICNS